MSGLPRSSHALVTGGGRGIGRAIAAALAQAGATVTVLGRNRATLDEAVAAGDAHFAAVADVADQAAVERRDCGSRRAAADRYPDRQCRERRNPRRSAHSDAALFQRMMDVNFMGVVHATQAVLPGMMERRLRPDRRRRIDRRPQGLRLCHAYSAAKHAVIGLVRSLALELAKTRRHRQRGMPRLHRNRSARRQIDNIMKKTGRSREQAIAELSRHNPQGRLVSAVGSGRCRAVAVRRGRRRHHRTGHRGGRRRSLSGRHMR